MSKPEVIFRPKSDHQRDNCINDVAEHHCPHKSTLEAVFGCANIRCCGHRECMEVAAAMAKKDGMFFS